MLSRSRSPEFRKSHSKSRTRKDQPKIGHLKNEIKQRTVEQVVNIHAQHDVHAVKMEQSKIIKNNVQRNNPIIQEKINQVRCKAKSTANKPCKNRGRATRMGHLPCRYTMTDANDATGTEYQSGEIREDLRLSKIPVTMQKHVQIMQKMLKEQADHPDTLGIATDPVHNEKTREKESGSAAEEPVPDVHEAQE